MPTGPMPTRVLGVTSLDDLSQPEQYRHALTILTDVTDALLDTVRFLEDAAVAAPSLCEGWTRGHVLTHLARNADALRNLVTWARTGTETPMYASREQRAADIDAGAGRSASDLESDVEASADRLLDDLLSLSDASLSTVLRTGTGAPMPAHDLPYTRAREVAFHHVDLDTRYTFAALPAEFVSRALTETGERLTQNGAGPVELVATDTGQRVRVGDTPRTEVTGPASALLGWATGRTDGRNLLPPAGGLPKLPAWG